MRWRSSAVTRRSRWRRDANRRTPGSRRGRASPRPSFAVTSSCTSSDPEMLMRPALTRREMLTTVACGFGGVALAGLLADEAIATTPTDPLAAKPSHFTAKAKRVIFLFLHGGVSHVDTFDPKPKLAELNGKPLPFAKPQFE